MQFNVRCPKCRKLYAAEWRLIGKQIRCRQCGEVFPITEPSEHSEAELAPVGAARDRGSATTVTGHLPLDEPEKPAGRPIFRDLQLAPPDHEPPETIRPSRPLDFPMSAALERWLVLLLPLLGITWALKETFSSDLSGKLWVPAMRVAVILGIYLIIVVPITLKVLTEGLRNTHYAAPPTPKKRAAAAFALPAVLGYVLWLISGTIVSLITGLIVGLLVAAPVYWVLFRQDWKSAGIAYGMGSGAFLGACAVGAALLLGINFTLNQVLIATHSVAGFRISPFGQTFSWNVPPEQLKEKMLPHPDVTAPQQKRSLPPTEAQPSAPAQGPSGRPPIARAVNSQRPSNTTQPDSTATSPGMEASNSGLFSTKQGITQPDRDPFLSHLQAAKPAWVTGITSIDLPSQQPFQYEQVSSSFIGIVGHTNDGGEFIESCNLAPFARIGSLEYNGESYGMLPPRGQYAMTPDGKQLVRLTDFPRRMLEISSFERPTDPPQAIPLVVLDHPAVRSTFPVPDRSFTPEIMAVLPENRVLLRWYPNAGEKDILELFEYKAPRSVRTWIPAMGPGALGAGTYAISQDAKWLAMIIPDPAGGMIKLPIFNLSGLNRAPLVFQIADLDQRRWQIKPTGLAFSPDDKKVAVLFEHEGDGLIITCDIPEKRRLPDTVCQLPSARALSGMSGCGRGFDWLTNDAWLVHGGTVLRASTGAVLARLTSDPITGQQMINDHTFCVTYRESDDKNRVAVLSFDPAAVTSVVSHH